MFQLLVWKEFKNRKMVRISKLVETDDLTGEKAIKKMMQYNAQTRKTTTGYHIYDLAKLFENNGIALTKIEDKEKETKEEAKTSAQTEEVPKKSKLKTKANV